MLSNAYFLAKFRFDTAENEPAKNLQSLKKSEKTLILLDRRIRSGAPAHGRRAAAAPGHLGCVPEEGREEQRRHRADGHAHEGAPGRDHRGRERGEDRADLSWI